MEAELHKETMDGEAYYRGRQLTVTRVRAERRAMTEDGL